MQDVFVRRVPMKGKLFLAAAAALSISSACSRSSSQAAAASKDAGSASGEASPVRTSAPRQLTATAASQQADPHATMISQMKSALIGHAHFDGAVIISL